MGHLSFTNLAELDALFKRYEQDPASLDPSWRAFFDGWSLARETLKGGERPSCLAKEAIEAYRRRGHEWAKSNPLQPPPENASLYTEADLTRSFPTYGLLPEKEAPLKAIIARLKEIYCGSLGVEYKGIVSSEGEKWIEERLESSRPSFSAKEKEEILHLLIKAEVFEAFIHIKYPGKTRFSLEGCDTFIPMCAAILDRAKGHVVIGMAHRGRLNLMANLLGKPYEEIFAEFDDTFPLSGSGDVKYHKGIFGIKRGDIEVTLTPNPSHLEAVDPVAEGMVRALQDLGHSKMPLPILVHGDAALAGQGVVYEILQCARLKGYETGGTIHIVLNNQVGFTTLPEEGRSTPYCTDIAKAFGLPVFHVNGEDPEACVFAARLALQWREQFHTDVFVDLIGYRKYGHNEGDEPAFTQPLEYGVIKEKRSIRSLYSEDTEFEKRFREELERAKVQGVEETEVRKSASVTLPPISLEALKGLLEELTHPKEGFTLHPKVENMLASRRKMVEEGVNWTTAELLGFATLLLSGLAVRLSGQDVRRGTFSQRHAMLFDQKEKGKKYAPLSQLKGAKAPFEVYNSPLSEYAVMGFEFGYTLSNPQALVIWEAQYGDFVNGAQIIVDQFLSVCEEKWGITSNLTLFLPHGYEGMGPEHSSARLERFLQLGAKANMQIAIVTTPAQLFHLLRRQAVSRKPLVLFTPKAMLRHPKVVSPLAELATGSFHPWIEEKSLKAARKLLLCSGKIFFDLMEVKGEDIAIVRLEELYPLDVEGLKSLAVRYANVLEVAWVQEEPENMGAWFHLAPLLGELFSRKITYIGRERSASPATGSHRRHKEELNRILERVKA